MTPVAALLACSVIELPVAVLAAELLTAELLLLALIPELGFVFVDWP